jgi:restriction system protein
VKVRDIPKFDELMLPTIEALKALGGSASNEELHDWIADHLALPAEIRDRPHGDGTTTELRYRLHWARSYLKAFGAINNSERGVWTLTEAGVKVTAGDVAAIKKVVREKRYAQRKAALAAADDAPEVPIGWTEQLTETLKSMTAAGFERLCQRVLRESGFTKVEVTGQTGDGGSTGSACCGSIWFHFMCFSKLSGGRGPWARASCGTFAGRWSGARTRGSLSQPQASPRRHAERRRVMVRRLSIWLMEKLYAPC